MTRALVTQLADALESGLAYVENEANQLTTREYKTAITAAREYLATEPSDERAELIAQLRDAHGRRFDTSPSPYSRAADMLEADADLRTQLARRTVERDMVISMIGDCIDAQQAKRVPMTMAEITSAWGACIDNRNRVFEIRTEFARAIEAHHGITQADKPTDWSAA